MRLNPPAVDLLSTLQRYSGDKLTRTEDLAILLEAASQHNALETFEELSFHAKFVANAGQALHRVSPSDANAARLTSEMHAEIANVTRLIRLLLAHSPLSVQDRFSTTYFAATADSLQNFLALCYDLSWYKNWLIDHPGGSPVAEHSPVRSAGFALWRVALCVLLLSALTWFGSFVTRAVVGNELLEPGTGRLITTFSLETEQHLYRVLAASAIPMVIGYILLLISSAVFLSTSPLRLRENGWLLMSALLLYLFVPVEVFVLSLDVRMISVQFFGNADVPALRELFLARLGALAGAPFIAVLCYLTIVPLAIFQPLRRKAQQAS